MRDHLPRELLCLYYPSGATVSMGATSIISGSPYFSVDREGFQWEDRLIPQLSPEAVQERAVATGVTELSAWREAMEAAHSTERGGGVEYDAVDARLAEAALLVGPEAGLRMRFVEVPPGSLVLCHRDLFHRGSRREPCPFLSFAKSLPVTLYN